MIQLPVTLGDHRCTWVIDGATMPGIVNLAANAAPSGPVDETADEWDVAYGEDGVGHTQTLSPQSKTYDKLAGTLRDGRDFIVLDARLNKFIGQGFIRGKLAVCGLGLGDSNLMFDSISFQVGGLTELSGVAPVKRIAWPNHLETPGAEFRMEWNPD